MKVVEILEVFDVLEVLEVRVVLELGALVQLAACLLKTLSAALSQSTSVVTPPTQP